MIKAREGLISLIKKVNMSKIIKVTLDIQVWLIIIRIFLKKTSQCLKSLNNLNQILLGVQGLAQNQ